ncbi:hypothetical protein P0W64_15130 [Tsukamurella sp. 8F]|uniref:hypothetical protein n=1 Tax=unclassified Tsukamurella TaxID=2633480 RepID=UPI0023B91608|nr:MULTISPECIES: hypothetical protein [unclassified Tsukamurella]MDF0532540.1 hypothetical protein [Tsukamurella sp. 8J]MDF0588110.1 hypothetical protein [Tsukamurella sp. 8F]
MSYYDPRDDRTRALGPADAYQQGYDDAYTQQQYTQGHAQPGYAPTAQPKQPPALDIPKFVMGSLLVAVVAGLAAWLTTAALNWLYRLADSPAFAAAERPLTLTIVGAAFLTLVGAGLLALLIMSAPRPGLFFVLIATGAGLVITLGPLASGATSWQMWVSTGVINVVLCLVVPILLYQVGRATANPRRVRF